MKYIKEIFGRLGLKSPSFFVIIQKVSLLVTTLSGLPLLLQQLQQKTGFIVPEFMTNLSNKIFFFCGIVSFLISKLPVENPDAVKIKDDKVVPKLPFTKGK